MNIKNIKLIIISLSILAVLIYFINLNFRISDKTNSIKDKEAEISKLENNIKIEKKNNSNIESASKDFLKNAYFDRDNDYFEKYIRTLFDKYRVEIKIYHTKLNDENFSELDLNFIINSFDFFKLLKDIELGDKLVVISKLNINRDKLPNLKIAMKLKGFYK